MISALARTKLSSSVASTIYPRKHRHYGHQCRQKWRYFCTNVRTPRSIVGQYCKWRYIFVYRVRQWRSSVTSSRSVRKKYPYYHSKSKTALIGGDFVMNETSTKLWFCVYKRIWSTLSASCTRRASPFYSFYPRRRCYHLRTQSSWRHSSEPSRIWCNCKKCVYLFAWILSIISISKVRKTIPKGHKHPKGTSIFKKTSFPKDEITLI